MKINYKINYNEKYFDDVLKKIYKKIPVAKSENPPYYLKPVLEKKAHDTLTVRQEICFFLYYKKNHTMHYVADSLNISTPAVCKNLKVARKKLLKSLKNYTFPKDFQH